MGVTPAIVGSIEATEVLKIICGFGDVLAGELWTIDLRHLFTSHIELSSISSSFTSIYPYPVSGLSGFIPKVTIIPFFDASFAAISMTFLNSSSSLIK